MAARHSPLSGLWLASSSPRRRAILRALGLGFRAVTPGPDLDPAVGPRDPGAYAVANARHKAQSAADGIRDGLVIGCDTVVCIGNRVLGKPADAADARRALKLLSGRAHRVISGVAVISRPGGGVRTGVETTLVTFRRLSPGDIDAYLATGEPFDKAGGYGIQGWAGRFVTSVRGSYLNVVGLPVARLLELLESG